jgi:hypothetical protein
MATDKEQLIEIIVAATRKGNNGVDVVDLGEIWPGDELGSFEPLAKVLRDSGIKFDSEGNGQ